MTFGEKLQKLRRGKGLSQEELAAMLDVTRQTVSKWELSQSTPELEYIAKLSDIYGVTTDYLIKKDVQATPVSGNEQVCQTPAQSQTEERRVRYSSVFVLGLVVACLGMLGVAAFVVASAMDPVIYGYNDADFYGVVAYVLYTGTFWWFVFLCTMVVAGIAAAVWGIFRQRKAK